MKIKKKSGAKGKFKSSRQRRWFFAALKSGKIKSKKKITGISIGGNRQKGVRKVLLKGVLSGGTEKAHIVKQGGHSSSLPSSMQRGSVREGIKTIFVPKSRSRVTNKGVITEKWIADKGDYDTVGRRGIGRKKYRGQKGWKATLTLKKKSSFD